jgi:hypothetical protein
LTAPAHAPAIAFLRRTGLFAAVLALIAGIFGMHVMTATHTMHSPAAAAPAVSFQHELSSTGHMGAHAPGASDSATGMPGMPDQAGTRTVQCTDTGNCTSMQPMTGACTPSPKTGSLAAPLPGTGIIARTINTGPAGAVSTRWAYLPGSTSPGELCISRT